MTNGPKNTRAEKAIYSLRHIKDVPITNLSEPALQDRGMFGAEYVA
jgi:hypothetical protein